MNTWATALALVNIFSIGAILASGVGLKKISRSETANALLVMFICICLEIAGVTLALFWKDYEMQIRLASRFIELLGVAYFLFYVARK